VQFKIALVKALGLGVDNTGSILDEQGKPIVDEYVKERVTLANMAILPGSRVILVDNEVSIAGYLNAHPDIQIE
jgi:homoaconitase/3-isopropylmalate dehydratase large subunit